MIRRGIITATIGLALFLAFTPSTSNVSACACSCAMVCDNRCQFSCSGCDLSEQIEKSTECCNGAGYGETGPCHGGFME